MGWNLELIAAIDCNIFMFPYIPGRLRCKVTEIREINNERLLMGFSVEDCKNNITIRCLSAPDLALLIQRVIRERLSYKAVIYERHQLSILVELDSDTCSLIAVRNCYRASCNDIDADNTLAFIIVGECIESQEITVKNDFATAAYT